MKTAARVSSAAISGMIVLSIAGHASAVEDSARKTEAHMTATEKEKAWKAVETCQAAYLLALHGSNWDATFHNLSHSYRALEKGAYVTQLRAVLGLISHAGHPVPLIARSETIECRIDASDGKLLNFRRNLPRCEQIPPPPDVALPPCK